MENIEIDLFEYLELLPENIKEIVLKYSELDNTYQNCNNLLNELKPLGYIFDYYLDAEPYNLRKI